MCLALYLASENMLPFIPAQSYPEGFVGSSGWPGGAQRFHTAELRQDQESVRMHFTFPNVVYAGSYEGCGCGFNFGREYPADDLDLTHVLAANESVAELVRYVRNEGVRQIYGCWFDEEAQATVAKHTVLIDDLASPGFFFGLGVLLNLSSEEASLSD